VAARHIIIVVFASVLSAMAAIGIAFIWTRMRRGRNHLHHDGM
jgi:ABC-type proline/glycine betaine transport system permease subunit